MSILLYEPDIDNYDVIDLVLSEAGYQVSGLDGLEKGSLNEAMAKPCPEMVILNHYLNERILTEALRILRSKWPTVPMLTTSCNSDINERYHKMGMDGYIQKPFDLDEFIETVDSFLSTTPRRGLL